MTDKGEHAGRQPPDQVLVDLADYVHSGDSRFNNKQEAYNTARLCFIDTLGCGFEALRTAPACINLLGPVVKGTTVPNGTKIPGTPFQVDPIRGAWNIGVMIRWLDFNDGFFAAEWGHPSDFGAILAVADYVARSGQKKLTVKDVLEAMIQAHEIQGIVGHDNSFNQLGLDHTILIKLASSAVCSRLLGMTRDQTVDVVSHVFVDGQTLRTYRHAPNTVTRKSWAAGHACKHAVDLAMTVQMGEEGCPQALTAKKWGFYDVTFRGKQFTFSRPYGSYVMENVLFKISYPAEFHAQSAVECAHILHSKLKEMGKTSDEVESVKIRTQSPAMKIINKQGPLANWADRDHTIQYMVAIPLVFGRLTSDDYHDHVAKDPRIDALREKMFCVEDPHFSEDYLNPESRSIANAITVTLKDGTKLDEVEIKYPIGHKRRRKEGTPLLEAKFRRHITPHFSTEHAEEIIKLTADQKRFEAMPIDKFIDMLVTDKIHQESTHS